MSFGVLGRMGLRNDALDGASRSQVEGAEGAILGGNGAAQCRAEGECGTVVWT